MESSNDTAVSLERNPSPLCLDGASVAPPAQEWITIAKQQCIELEAQAYFWQSLQGTAKVRIEEPEQELLRKDAIIKDQRNRYETLLSAWQNFVLNQEKTVTVAECPASTILSGRRQSPWPVLVEKMGYFFKPCFFR